MASCFNCEIVLNVGAEAEPIGMCAKCSSLTCVDHGTRLKGVPQFKCVLCATADMKTSAGLIIHERYAPPPGGDSGGPQAPVPPGQGPEGGQVNPCVVDSHEEFELSIPTARIAELSAKHRRAAAEVVDLLIEKVERFGVESEREDMVDELAATSDESTRAAIREAGARVQSGVVDARESGRLDRDLLADCIGLATWAIGEEVDAEMSVDRIALVADADIRFLLRVKSRYFAQVVEGG